MSTRHAISQLATALALLCASTALAQFTLDWHTINGGPDAPGFSTFGMYSLSGTIDRPNASSFSPPEAGEADKQALDDAGRPQITPDQVLPSGHRRVFQTLRLAISPDEVEQARRLGKTVKLDPQTGERILETFTDYLPVNWRMRASAGERIDSYGNPILNETHGLPGWAQRDIDALRAAIVTWRDKRAPAAAAGQDTTEIAGALGNFVGQAIVRGIAVEDLVRLDDASAIDAAAADAIIGYLHFYENLKFVHADDGRYTYEPTVYPAWVRDFVSARGASLDDVLAIEPPQEGGTRGGEPSGCYTRTAFTRGMTYLTGQTGIWVENDADDESADIPTGFPLFFFYDCEDTDNNDAVRVSTNGYISFFQQGGGALDGVDFSNDPIPSAVDPDGYVAPWWDDLVIASNQGDNDAVWYKIEGGVDERVFTVEWWFVSRFGGDSGNLDYHTFQVKLFESTDVVDLHYGTDQYWSPDVADDATMGIEDFAGDGGDCGPNCLNTNNPEPTNNYRFRPFPRPANDACASATQVSAGTSVTGNLHRATFDGDATCGSSEHNRDVWYTFIAECAGTLSVNTCGSRDINGQGSGIDSVLSVHAGCPGTEVNQLACNDDAGGPGCDGVDSAVSLPMTVGQRVFIRVTHFSNEAFRFASGAFRLNVEFLPTSTGGYDNCGSAIVVGAGASVGGDLTCATADGSATCGDSAGNPDIWYQFTAPSPGTLALNTCGSRDNAGPATGPDTVLSVHSACPGTTGNQLACSDDGALPGCHPTDSGVSLTLTPGQNVKVRVTHFGSGAFRVGNGVTLLNVDFGCEGPCPGDLEGDGQVDLGDLTTLLSRFGACHPQALYSVAADLDCDACIDLGDLTILLSRFGSPCP